MFPAQFFLALTIGYPENEIIQFSVRQLNDLIDKIDETYHINMGNCYWYELTEFLDNPAFQERLIVAPTKIYLLNTKRNSSISKETLSHLYNRF